MSPWADGPLMVGSLLSEKGFLPAYHMNKNTWISVLLDDSVSDEKISALLEFSYDSVAPKEFISGLRLLCAADHALVNL